MAKPRILGVWLALAACDRAGSAAPSLQASTPAPGVEAAVVEARPDPDGDGDGVPDREDACAGEAGAQADGCPPRDGDGDGLLDAADGCPEAGEARNGFEDGDGCPDELPAELQAIVGVVPGIVFDFNKDTIKRASFAALDEIAAALLKYPTVRVEISGHSDDTASNVMRGALTARRAQAVKRYLISRGVAEDRVLSEGYGPERPIASNKTAAGRAKNRRVELAILVAPAGP